MWCGFSYILFCTTWTIRSNSSQAPAPSKHGKILLILIGITGILILITLILTLFYWASKNGKNEFLGSTTFECGFSSYFYSRHSFSIHYYLVALIFLFLDLEVCFMLPFLVEDTNNPLMWLYVAFFAIVLLLGLIKEWIENKLDWEF